MLYVSIFLFLFYCFLHFFIFVIYFFFFLLIFLFVFFFFFFFSSRRRHTRFDCDWSSDVCSSDLRSTMRSDPRACKTYGPISRSLAIRRRTLSGSSATTTRLTSTSRGARLGSAGAVRPRLICVYASDGCRRTGPQDSGPKQSPQREPATSAR